MKDALGHGSDAGGASHQGGVNRIGAYKPGMGPGTYKFHGNQVVIAEYTHGGIKTTGQVGTTGQSTHELASIIKQHSGDDRHSGNVRRAANLELMNHPVHERLAAGVM